MIQTHYVYWVCWAEMELMWQCKQRGAPVNTGEASLAGLLLTSCCMAQFLTDHSLVWVHGLGVGNPWFRRESILASSSFLWFQEFLALWPRHSNFCLYIIGFSLLYVFCIFLFFWIKLFSLFLFIYVAVSGLSCDMQDLCCGTGSL